MTGVAGTEMQGLNGRLPGQDVWPGILGAGSNAG